jgi:hypothetical protein
MTALAERVLQPLDGLRRLFLRTVLQVPPLRRALIRRSSRVPFLLSVHAAVAFGLAVLAPSLSLALAPILFGVPHVASDVRHLVLRRALPGWWRRATWAFAGALIAVRMLEEARILPQAPLRLEHAIASAWVVLAVVAGGISGGWRRATSVSVAAIVVAIVVAIVALAIAAGSLLEPRAFRLIFLQAHNLFAIAIWLLLFRRRLARACIPVAMVLVGATLLASGALLGVTIHRGALSCLGLHLFAAADWIAPGLPDAQAIALTTAFAFLQSVHYGIWLIAIPQDDARTEGRPTFRMAWRALGRDFSPAGARLTVGLAALVLLGGAVAADRTRVLFLSLATFHGWLELAVVGFLVARHGFGVGSEPEPGRPGLASRLRAAT